MAQEGLPQPVAHPRFTSYGGVRRSRHPFTNTKTRNLEGLALKFGPSISNLLAGLRNLGVFFATDPIVTDRRVTGRNIRKPIGLSAAQDPT